jgi:hypothetical protein
MRFLFLFYLTRYIGWGGEMAARKIEMLDLISRKEGVLTTDLDGEVAMLDIQSGKYFTLDGVSSDIWHMIEKPIAVQQIVSKLLEQYEIDELTCSQQTIEFLSSLHSLKMIDLYKQSA